MYYNTNEGVFNTSKNKVGLPGNSDMGWGTRATKDILMNEYFIIVLPIHYCPPPWQNHWGGGGDRNARRLSVTKLVSAITSDVYHHSLG